MSPCWLPSGRHTGALYVQPETAVIQHKSILGRVWGKNEMLTSLQKKENYLIGYDRIIKYLSIAVTQCIIYIKAPNQEKWCMNSSERYIFQAYHKHPYSSFLWIQLDLLERLYLINLRKYSLSWRFCTLLHQPLTFLLLWSLLITTPHQNLIV